MKTVTQAEAQATLPELLRAVNSGPEARLIQGKKAMAKIVPIRRSSKKPDWTTTWSKVDSIFGGKAAKGKPGSQIVIDGRR